ncbi:uncharacterized protein KIAA1522 [Mugil cephalus]|uniref:uncharacterized protein KIAA1522 n=1 Tax=Mugil cephalus TaxID=48193 RepID=UPI001FB72DD3|nr:uncharacterized protein KIAA1522 [Mugil cephalus]
MSNRDSLGFGDLLPKDVVEIFAQEKHRKRSRKQRTRSLRRAFGWLKGRKKKDLGANRDNPGLGPALDLALTLHPAGHHGGHKAGHKAGKQGHPQGNSHAVSKRDDDDDKTPAPPVFPENVFIEASRPKYLEDLHSEALEGLKMMQQEETNNGVEYRDNESTISAMTVQTDGESCGFVTDSTIADTTSVVSVQSSMSTRSTRSGLTRQGSTFTPLKKSEKSRTRRRHRKTVAGIPRHVQRELGLDRSIWGPTQTLDEEQLRNGENNFSPTTDGPQPEAQMGARAGVQAMNNIQPLNKNTIEQLNSSHAGHRDDLDLLRRLGPDLTGGQRPHSLAVPWMTTESSLQQESPGPVMSMSPQAAYLSKIIPNAVLPPSIDVVEISRGRSRSSVRTVSKSSLLLPSPAPSRASSRASSARTTSSRASNITSASRQNCPNLSDSSCWSNSDSSDTLVSDSSTISRSSTPNQNIRQNREATSKEDKNSVPSSNSNTSKYTANGKLIIKGDEAKKDGQFVRSLSVMKSKRAPPPPSRSYSLHSKMKRRSRDLAEVRVISGEPSPHRIPAPDEEKESPSMPMDSPGYNADTSSLDESTRSFSPFKSQLQVPKTEDAKKDRTEPLKENKLNKISPSSGYSSHDGTSPQHSAQPPNSSPRHKKGILAKLQRLFPGSASSASAASLPAQLEVPEKTKLPGKHESNSLNTVSVNPSVHTLRDLFNIPPPPKVHAPPAPPPEVWAHSKRSFELLLGPPAPDNLYDIIKRNPKDRRQQRQSPSVSTEGSLLVVERKPAVTVETANGSIDMLNAKKVQESQIVNAEVQIESNDRQAQNVVLEGSGKDEKARVSDILNGMLVKTVEKREERLTARKEEEAKNTPTQGTDLKTKMDTLPAIALARISPSPSPPIAHRSVQSVTRQTIEGSSGTTVKVVSPESSWPPPPPPMAQAGLGGSDEIDFPLPPPPSFREEDLDDQVPQMSSIHPSDVKTQSIKVIPETESQKPSKSQEITPSPPNIPPPPSYTAPPPPTTAVSPPTTNKISPPPPVEVSPVRPKESSAVVVQDVAPLVKDTTHPRIKVASPSPVKEVPPPLVTVVAHSPVKEVLPPPVFRDSPLPHKEASAEVPPPSPPKDASQSSEEALPVSKLIPPQSIPPPPPLPSQPQSSEQETNPVSPNSILTPPQSIPPPPQDQPEVVPPNIDDPPTQETSPSPPSKDPMPPAPETTPSPVKAQEPAPSPPINIPIPPPLPLQGLASDKPQPSPSSTENESLEQKSAPVVQEEPSPIITPSLLQTVKLRSINNSPEPPTAEEQPQAEASMRKQQPSNQVPTSSASNEAPQKPIRKSLIVTSPTSATPPVIINSQPTLPSDIVIPPTSTATSPVRKSPPAMATSPSMNLQEAIRLRTAARSKESPSSRLSVHSATSPLDLQRSPTNTASFIFSKSNKKVVIDTKPEAKEDLQKNLEASSVTKEEVEKKEVKVPPPVAKKPKPRGKEVEANEDTERTAGQEAQKESTKDATQKTNGTDGTVEGGETSSS